MYKRLEFFAFLLVLLIGAANTQAKPHPCSMDGVAIDGYDLISYHQPDGPGKGAPEHAVTHQGSIYHFVDAGNKALFEADPEKYLPVYRGWCAATLSMGRLVCPDYTNFKLEEGRLLFFELAGFTNGRTLWNSDPEGFRQRADENALKLLKP
jgi:hypothetical protein